jgi:hypothetical protein
VLVSEMREVMKRKRKRVRDKWKGKEKNSINQVRVGSNCKLCYGGDKYSQHRILNLAE